MPWPREKGGGIRKASWKQPCSSDGAPWSLAPVSARGCVQPETQGVWRARCPRACRTTAGLTCPGPTDPAPQVREQSPASEGRGLGPGRRGPAASEGYGRSHQCSHTPPPSWAERLSRLRGRTDPLRVSCASPPVPSSPGRDPSLPRVDLPAKAWRGALGWANVARGGPHKHGTKLENTNQELHTAEPG